MRWFSKERYFFISYNFKAGDLCNGFGQMTFVSNGMPKLKRITETCTKQIKGKVNENVGEIGIVIIMLKELSRKDYNNFIIG